MQKKRILLLKKLFYKEVGNIPNKSQLRQLKKHFLRHKDIYEKQIKKLNIKNVVLPKVTNKSTI